MAVLYVDHGYTKIYNLKMLNLVQFVKQVTHLSYPCSTYNNPAYDIDLLIDLTRLYMTRHAQITLLWDILRFTSWNPQWLMTTYHHLSRADLNRRDPEHNTIWTLLMFASEQPVQELYDANVITWLFAGSRTASFWKQFYWPAINGRSNVEVNYCEAWDKKN